MNAFIRQIEKLIRDGQVNKARLELAGAESRRLSRPDIGQLAAVARRAGLPFMTLRLLTPIVRPSPKQYIRASESEKAEYAAALVRVGATNEALEILKSIDPKSTPQVLLYQAHALFTRWDYESTIPLLSKYVQHATDAYQRIIGKVNLAGALVHERKHLSAQKLLEELVEETGQQKLRVLHGNTLERLAELAIGRQQWKQASDYLSSAEKAVKEAGGQDEFFVRKWWCILNLAQKKTNALSEMALLRKEAIKKQHWETVRECDYYQATITNNFDLLQRVYFGTPIRAYRKRLLSDYKSSARLPDHFNWSFESAIPAKITLDLLRDPPMPKSAGLKFGQLKYRLLKILVSDFYRPFRVANVFDELYPGERFHIDNSRARIHQSVKELRNWFSSHQIPLGIQENNGSYRLNALKSNVTLTVPSPEWWIENSLKGLNRIRSLAKLKPFSTQHLADWLNISRRSAANWLKEATTQNIVTKIGAVPRTLYCLKA